MGLVGPEHPSKSPGKTHVPGESGAKSGALPGDSVAQPAPATPTDPDLAAVIAAWPSVPLAVRAGILAMVKASKVGGVG